MLKLYKDSASDLSLNINLVSKPDYLNDGLDKYVDQEVQKSIKQNRNNEFISFKPSNSFSIKPYFKNENTYLNAEFVESDFIAGNNFIDASYWFFDIYDTYDKLNQNLLSRNFVKMEKVLDNGVYPIINFKNEKLVKEYTNIYIPTYFIGTEVFMEIRFFNSRNGRLRTFQTNDKEGALQNYFNIKLDTENQLFIINNDGLILDNGYRINEIIEVNRETNEINSEVQPTINLVKKTKKTITTKGIFIW